MGFCISRLLYWNCFAVGFCVASTAFVQGFMYALALQEKIGSHDFGWSIKMHGVMYA